jgi:Zn-dependent peptidase ImmA (M78 family)/transcriptional regulator with XRE-family HTH domain
MNDRPCTPPKALTWARESASLSIQQASEESGISSRILTALERGKIEINQSQLSNLAKTYQRPLFCFYLPEPPAEIDKALCFRQQVSTRNPEQSHDLEVLIRDLSLRHAILKYAKLQTHHESTVNLIGSLKGSQSVQEVCQHITRALGLGRQDIRQTSSLEAGFKCLRAALERVGIVVMLSGHPTYLHGIMPVGLYESFSVIDPSLPLITLNENSPHQHWVFVLIYQLAHLVLGESGTDSFHLDCPAEEALHLLCEKIAYEFLFEPEELLDLNVTSLSINEQVRRIRNAATQRHVAPEILVLRLFDSKRLSREQAIDLIEQNNHLRQQNQAANREVFQESFNVLNEHDLRMLRLGDGMIKLTRQALLAKILSRSEGAKVLGTKESNVIPFLNHALDAQTLLN